MAIHDLDLQFAEHSTERHGLELLRPADAAAYISRCREHGIEVLDVDGFRLDGDSIQPLMEHSVDFTVPPTCGAHYDEAADYLASRPGRKSLWGAIKDAAAKSAG